MINGNIIKNWISNKENSDEIEYKKITFTIGIIY